MTGGGPRPRRSSMTTGGGPRPRRSSYTGGPRPRGGPSWPPRGGGARRFARLTSSSAPSGVGTAMARPVKAKMSALVKCMMMMLCNPTKKEKTSVRFCFQTKGVNGESYL